MKRKLLAWFCVLLFALGVANFASFIVICHFAGGDVDHVEDGRYFLWDKGAERGGRTTEVSRFTYLWLLWQRKSLWVTHPLALLAGYYVFREQERRNKERSHESSSSESRGDSRCRPGSGRD